jgi:transcriptional regulator with XRE-family HTH domain
MTPKGTSYTPPVPFNRRRMAQLRARNVLTQLELAEAAGLAEMSVNQIENGRAEPRPSTIRKLARALGVKPSELIVDDEEDL